MLRRVCREKTLVVQQKAIPQTALVEGGPEEDHMKLPDEGSCSALVGW